MSLVIGMNSGSSADAIDVVLIELEVGDDGVPVPPKLIDAITHEWPDDIHEKIIRAIRLEMSIPEIVRLNFSAGAVYGNAVKKLMSMNSLKARDIEVIGVDGQSIYQESVDRSKNIFNLSYLDKFKEGEYACTFQIGESAVIAALTGAPVVTHFRLADIALGGTGAPLMQYLDYVRFRSIAPVATLNIGGIANVHVVNNDKNKMIAFDTGPGNVMMDYMAQHMFNMSCDTNGKIAASGKINDKLLAELLDHPFLKKEPPRNAWRRDFGEGYIEEVINKYSDVQPKDLMATFNEMTSIAITTSFKNYIYPRGVRELIASGGGTKNITLMKSMKAKLQSGSTIVTSDKYGIPAQFKEAIKFGVLGFATMHKIPNNLPSCSGASGYTVLGKVSFPPEKEVS